VWVRGEARIFTRSCRVAETVAAMPGMADRMYRFEAVDGIAIPPGGLYVGRVPDYEWGVDPSLVPYLSYQRAHRKLPWLRDVWPTLAWRDLLHHAGEPVVYHWYLERGDDLYAEFALLNGALVALQTHLMGLPAAYPPDGFYVMGEVWRHLGLRSPLMYFPPNDRPESAWPPM
jgi:hypothetical protein